MRCTATRAPCDAELAHVPRLDPALENHLQMHSSGAFQALPRLTYTQNGYSGVQSALVYPAPVARPEKARKSLISLTFMALL